MKPIETPYAPLPAGHYSQAITHGGMIYVAGQLPIDPATGSVIDGDMAVQAERTLQNVEAILLAAGSGLDRVVMLNVFLTTRDDWAAVNAVCERMFGYHRPARAAVGGADLKPGCRVEITAVAVAADP